MNHNLKAVLVLMLCLGGSASRAWAEDVRVHLHSGEVLTGHLVDVAPDHVTVDLGSGEHTRFARASVKTLDRDVPVVHDEVAQRPPSEASRAVAMQVLLAERAYWTSRYTNSAAPMLATVLGVAGLVAGAGLLSAYAGSETERCTRMEFVPVGNFDGYYTCAGGYVKEWKEGYKIGAITSLAVGGVSLVTGIVLWSVRTSVSTQRENLQRIDDQLKLTEASVRVQPWMDLQSGGLLLTSKF
jgi:hypothetical protein